MISWASIELDTAQTPVDFNKFQNISPVVSARALAKLQNQMHKLRVQFSNQLFKGRIRETTFFLMSLFNV